MNGYWLAAIIIAVPLIAVCITDLIRTPRRKKR